jgi:hypothetical protein
MGIIASSSGYHSSSSFNETCANLPSAEKLRKRHKSALLDPCKYPPNVQFDATQFAEAIVKISENASPEYNCGITFNARPESEAIQIVSLMKMIEQWPSEAFYVCGERCENAPSCGCSPGTGEYCSYRPACHPFWLDSWSSELVKMESQV